MSNPFSTVFPDIEYFQSPLTEYARRLYVTLYDQSLSITEIPQEIYVFKRTIKDKSIADGLLIPLNNTREKKIDSIDALYVIRANKYQGSDPHEKMYNWVLELFYKMLHNPNTFHYLMYSRRQKYWKTETLLKEFSIHYDATLTGITRERLIFGPKVTLYIYGIIRQLDEKDIDYYLSITNIRGNELDLVNNFIKKREPNKPSDELLLAANELYGNDPTGKKIQLTFDNIVWDPRLHFYTNFGLKCVNILIALRAINNDEYYASYTNMITANLSNTNQSQMRQ